MSKTQFPSPSLNRLRAASGLIPLIEDGLRSLKLNTKRAALMAKFCGWAASGSDGSAEAERLADEIRVGLDRLKAVMEKDGDECQSI